MSQLHLLYLVDIVILKTYSQMLWSDIWAHSSWLVVKATNVSYHSCGYFSMTRGFPPSSNSLSLVQTLEAHLLAWLCPVTSSWICLSLQLPRNNTRTGLSGWLWGFIPASNIPRLPGLEPSGPSYCRLWKPGPGHCPRSLCVWEWSSKSWCHRTTVDRCFLVSSYLTCGTSLPSEIYK